MSEEILTIMQKTMRTAPVHGGELWYAERLSAIDDHDPAVLALHGLTANHVTFNHLSKALPNRRWITPDLRGYGASSTLAGPYGFMQHVEDIVALLDKIQSDGVDLVAHSMGASVAVILAAEYPERVKRLILLDGGLPSEPPASEGMSIDASVRALMGPTADRLERIFESRASYLAERRKHPGLARCWDADVEEYVNYDLVGEPPALRPSTNPEAMYTDARDLFDGTHVRHAWELMDRPVYFMGASRGMLDEPPAVVQEADVLDFAETYSRLVYEFQVDSNHFSILMSPDGAHKIARMLESQSAA